MASLVIRDLDEGIKTRLRVQAAEHGRSMEAEARLILSTALSGRRPTRGLGSYIRDSFADLEQAELEIPPRSEPAQAADLGIGLPGLWIAARLAISMAVCEAD